MLQQYLKIDAHLKRSGHLGQRSPNYQINKLSERLVFVTLTNFNYKSMAGLKNGNFLRRKCKI